MKCFFGFILLTLFGLPLFAQESSVSATNPASLKWYQLNTPNFRLLYPQGFEAQAQRVANTLETIREPEGKTIGAVPRKISIVLQNQSALSNAFVSITPRRAEFYGMPSQNYNFVGTNDWLTLLSSHEYRHMAQFQHARRGVNKLLYYAFGYNTLAGLAYVGAPQWFWEGDAVATETAFTPSGRGRIPNFDLILRTNLQEGRVFNYHKQYLRSYKNNINDHYVLGYHMVSYLRKKTNDPQIWDKVTARAWNAAFVPLRFSSALKKETGLFVKDLYKEMAADLQKDWKAQQDTLRVTSFEKVNRRSRGAYTDYQFPQVLDDGSILVRKSGIGDIEKLVVIKDGNEKTVFTQGQINEAAMLSATNQRMVWNEYRYDPRWQVRNYSVVVGYDLNMKQKRVLGAKSRYAAAAISPDGYQVATVETDTEYKTHLVVIDYFSGRVVKTFDNPDNDFISMPRWTSDGKKIIALSTRQNRRSIVSFDFQSGAMNKLTEFSNENIGYPVPWGEFVFYNSPISGIDNIYAVDLATGQRFQVTSSKYGAYNPTVTKDGKWIYYNDQGRDGMDVAKIPFDPSSWKRWNNTEQSKGDYNLLVAQEGNQLLLNNLPQTVYETKRYRRWKGTINPYSWGATVSTTLTSAFIGVTSQDLLSTTQINAGYAYDKTEGTGAWTASVSYQGWYPIIDFSISESQRKASLGNIEIDSASGTKSPYKLLSRTNKDVNLSWKEKTVEGGLRLPFNTTTSKYFGSVTFGNAVGVTQVTDFTNSVNSERIVPALIINDTVKSFYYFFNYPTNGNLIYNRFTFSAYRLLKQSRRDINSKFGQALFLNILNTPYGGDFSGAQFSFYGQLYFPGLFKHHSLWGYWGYQGVQMTNIQKSGKTFADNRDYFFRNQVPLPRGGLGVARFKDFYTMSGNYTLPICYPDIAIGPLLNIQRIRANGFVDYGFGQGYTNNPTATQAYMSTGVEVKLDVNIMRLLPQLDIGFRYSKGIKPATSLFEVLIGTINF
ncbi:MAG TPA: hypothetical protein VL728_14470 [Cyclobacteriaceae bacterium]|jgi:hypothetical protein|nr:hypothetical protein [Cyclobacteriaceae bacterium]